MTHHPHWPKRNHWPLAMADLTVACGKWGCRHQDFGPGHGQTVMCLVCPNPKPISIEKTKGQSAFTAAKRHALGKKHRLLSDIAAVKRDQRGASPPPQ